MSETYTVIYKGCNLYCYKLTTKDKQNAKLILLKSEFIAGGFMYELSHGDKLEKEWMGKYSKKYDSRKVAFEYVIKMLTIVFKYVPDNAINEYTKYLNNGLYHWCFNKNIMAFEEN